MTSTSIDLAALGWDAQWQAALQPTTVPVDAVPGAGRCGAAWVIGRVARVDRSLATVLTASGPVRAGYGGELLHRIGRDPVESPCTGDWVAVRQWPDGPLTLEAVAPRRTQVLRAAPNRTSHEQVLAANVDTVAVVVALHPEPNLGRLERLLAVAIESGARPAVVLTKADLVVDAREVAEDVAAAAPDVPVVVCAPPTGLGVADVGAFARPGQTVALIGASGHGKSTLVNALVGDDVLLTRAIRADGRGRHTTVRRELVVLPGGGALIDTPGLRGVGVPIGFGGGSFPDLDRLAAQCRFDDCSHTSEPSCAVAAAVERGVVPRRRWESWQTLQTEARSAAAAATARRRRRSAPASARRDRDPLGAAGVRRSGG